MLDLIIKNGWVVNATHSQQTDIAVKDGKIVAMGRASLFPEAEKTVDAAGLWVLPGMIDTHVHMNKRFGASPSQDNYYNGSIAAAYGGTTAIVDFGFPYGDETPAQAMERKLEEIKGQSVIDYSFHSNLTKANEENSGFLPIERAWVDRFIAAGYVDTFRHIHGDEPHQYSWWSYKQRARVNNVGWRIDYFIVSNRIADKIKAAEIHNEVFGSDHCPVELDIDL